MVGLSEKGARTSKKFTYVNTPMNANRIKKPIANVTIFDIRIDRSVPQILDVSPDRSTSS